MAGEIVQYQKFNRRRQRWWIAESLDQLKEDVRLGFQSPVTSAIDSSSFRCNLHDGNDRKTCVTKLNLMWISVRVIRFSLGLANNYLKVPKFPESFPNLPRPCKFGLTTFRSKGGWNYSFYCEGVWKTYTYSETASFSLSKIDTDLV